MMNFYDLPGHDRLRYSALNKRKEDAKAILYVIDASTLQTYEGVSDANVLNGIAYIKASDSFLVTGKLWPLMFEVVFE